VGPYRPLDPKYCKIDRNACVTPLYAARHGARAKGLRFDAVGLDQRPADYEFPNAQRADLRQRPILTSDLRGLVDHRCPSIPIVAQRRAAWLRPDGRRCAHLSHPLQRFPNTVCRVSIHPEGTNPHVGACEGWAGTPVPCRLPCGGRTAFTTRRHRRLTTIQEPSANSIRAAAIVIETTGTFRRRTGPPRRAAERKARQGLRAQAMP
jgi:hypothetical protein